jgi:transposase
MRALVIPDAETVSLVLQNEIHRSAEGRYDHRLHAVLLVAKGQSPPQVARLLGDAPRTVEYWVQRFLDEGLAGLAEADRPGRPPRLRAEEVAVISTALRRPPSEVGLQVGLWDGPTLATFIEQRLGKRLGVRQCQRLFHQLGFHLRKPRPIIARADAAAQQESKKNSEP